MNGLRSESAILPQMTDESTAEARLASLERSLQACRKELADSRAQLKSCKQQARELSWQVYKLRSRKSLRLIKFFSPSVQNHSELPGELQPFVDYAAQTYTRLSTLSLDESVDLSSGDVLEYTVRLPLSALQGIYLSIALDVSADAGVMRTQLLTKAGDILRFSSIDLRKVQRYECTGFEFQTLRPAECASRDVVLRISVEEANIPVRLREWVQFNLWKFKMISLPFIAFQIVDQSKP